eukprot:2039463-Pyramimonas_sp.AAC.2
MRPAPQREQHFDKKTKRKPSSRESCVLENQFAEGGRTIPGRHQGKEEINAGKERRGRREEKEVEEEEEKEEEEEEEETRGDADSKQCPNSTQDDWGTAKLQCLEPFNLSSKFGLLEGSTVGFGGQPSRGPSGANIEQTPVSKVGNDVGHDLVLDGRLELSWAPTSGWRAAGWRRGGACWWESDSTP